MPPPSDIRNFIDTSDAFLLQAFKANPTIHLINQGDIYPRIVESWSNIASWLIMLAEYASQYSRTDDILGLCSDVLQGIAHEADHNPQKLELLSARITGVAICALLSQSPDVGGPVECAIVETFSSFVSTIEGRQNFILTLKSFSKTRRYYVIASLIECSVQLAAIPTNRGISRATIVQHLDRLTKAVVFLLEADDDLLPPLAKLTFIERCAASYTSIAEEASRDTSIRDAELWNLLSTSTSTFLEELILKHTTNPYSALTRALDGGLYTCVALCLLNLESRDAIEESLCSFWATASNYMFYTKTCRAWGISSKPDRNQKLWERYPQEKYPIMAGFMNSLEVGLLLRGQPEDLVNMCSNVKYLQASVNSRVILFDHTQSHRAHQITMTTPVAAQRPNIWKRINGVWDSRVEACVQSVQESSESIFMAEAAFAYGSDQVVYAFATLKVDDAVGERKRFRILNSVFRLGPRRVMYRNSYTLPEYGYTRIIANCITGLHKRDQKFIYDFNLDSLLNGGPNVGLNLYFKEQGHIPSFISRWDYQLEDVFVLFSKSKERVESLPEDSFERRDALEQLKGRHDWFLDILEAYLLELDVFLWLKCHLGLFRGGMTELKVARVARINAMLREMVKFNARFDEEERPENKVYVDMDLELRWADLGIPSYWS
ncbi:hypothetical protein MD484_g8038, partial [Candolleomyces efflorescens]